MCDLAETTRSLVSPPTLLMWGGMLENSPPAPYTVTPCPLDSFTYQVPVLHGASRCHDDSFALSLGLVKLAQSLLLHVKVQHQVAQQNETRQSNNTNCRAFPHPRHLRHATVCPPQKSRFSASLNSRLSSLSPSVARTERGECKGAMAERSMGCPDSLRKDS